MENFEFKSQICTSIEESKRLLALGLKKETADMGWVQLLNGNGYVIGIAEDYSFIDVPAWSLHRLMELYSDVEDTSSLCIKDISYKLLIFCIEKAIHCRLFNKDYLEEKK